MLNANRLLNIKEIADLLNVSEWTIRKWLSQGLLPSIRVGTKLHRFNVDEVLEYFRNGKFLENKRQKMNIRTHKP